MPKIPHGVGNRTPLMWGFIPHAVGENINQILFIKKTGDMELSSLSPAYLLCRYCRQMN